MNVIRASVFVFFLIFFVITFFMDIVSGLILLPSVFLSYWVWHDGEEIEDQRLQLANLRKKVKSLIDNNKTSL